MKDWNKAFELIDRAIELLEQAYEDHCRREAEEARKEAA